VRSDVVRVRSAHKDAIATNVTKQTTKKENEKKKKKKKATGQKRAVMRRKKSVTSGTPLGGAAPSEKSKIFSHGNKERNKRKKKKKKKKKKSRREKKAEKFLFANAERFTHTCTCFPFRKKKSRIFFFFFLSLSEKDDVRDVFSLNFFFSASLIGDATHRPQLQTVFSNDLFIFISFFFLFRSSLSSFSFCQQHK
jgi:hypothetical protein